MNGLIPTEKRKAVAPIIATLLMVAIAVVGGILIFVFTQGFFTETDTSGTSNDKIEIVGYDFTDGATIGALTDHTGTVITNTVVTADSGSFTATDLGVIYVENKGDASATVKTVEVGGETYNFVTVATDTAAFTAAIPGEGQFIICDTEGCDAAGDLEQSGAVIDSGEVVSIWLEQTGNDLKNGRSVKITVTTENGGVATANAKMGKQRGS